MQLLGRVSPLLGRAQSPDHVAKRVAAITGKARTLEMRARMSKAALNRRSIRTLAERFAEKVGPRTLRENGWECPTWLAATYADGRGEIGRGGRAAGMVSAPRVAWELANGPVPDGQCVCHRCDHPDCTDVDHLFLGTQLDNIADMRSKGRHDLTGLSAGMGARWIAA